MTLQRALEIQRTLVNMPSVSCDSNRPISESIETLLQTLGFRTETVVYTDEQQAEKVSIIATRGSGSGGLLYSAHSDVVPADAWSFPEAGPFECFQTAGRVYGRGSCDMKGSLACFLAAAETVADRDLGAPLSLICTSDEELGFYGAAHVVKQSHLYRQFVEQQPVTIIGEPTLLEVVHAHKGVYVFKAISWGRAGHSSTSHGINANLAMIPFLQEMLAIYNETAEAPEWQDATFDPPGISWNIGINDFTYASNITPERSECTVCFRPMPNQPADDLMDRARRTAEKYGLDFIVETAAPPFHSPADADYIRDLLELTGRPTSRTVSYASDAAMFSELQKKVICGPGDIVQAHTEDEWISIDQMEQGTNLYQRMIERFCL